MSRSCNKCNAIVDFPAHMELLKTSCPQCGNDLNNAGGGYFIIQPGQPAQEISENVSPVTKQKSKRGRKRKV